MISDLLQAGPPLILADPLNFLRTTVPGNPVWDLARGLVSFSTVALALFYARIAFGGERPESSEEHKTIRVGIIGYLWLMLPTSLTELQQIGQPVLPWRLPMYLMFNIYGWWYVRRRL